tara:strand:+ start:418 stop:1344 length:927 start_codon:yes stop_codon:yes gene_type:complete
MMGFGKMRNGVFTSISAHLVVVLFAQFGLPQLFTKPPVSVDIIPVDLLVLDRKVTPPPLKVIKPELKTEAKPFKPIPTKNLVKEKPVQQTQKSLPPPPPINKPKPFTKKPLKKLNPKPTISTTAKPRLKPAPKRPDKLKPEKKTQKAKKIKQVKKTQKPKRDFASVLKDVSELKKPEQTLEVEKSKMTIKKQVSQLQNKKRASITEIERLKQMIRQQIQPCWSPPVGAKEAEGLAIIINIRVDKRGYVTNAKVLNGEAMRSSKTVQAAADAARRAVLNLACQPFELPHDLYEEWKDINFNFDPRKMLG